MHDFIVRYLHACKHVLASERRKKKHANIHIKEDMCLCVCVWVWGNRTKVNPRTGIHEKSEIHINFHHLSSHFQFFLLALTPSLSIPLSFRIVLFFLNFHSTLLFRAVFHSYSLTFYTCSLRHSPHSCSRWFSFLCLSFNHFISKWCAVLLDQETIFAHACGHTHKHVHFFLLSPE